jgi:quercetin dioxygenase-like cupin family protein
VPVIRRVPKVVSPVASDPDATPGDVVIARHDEQPVVVVAGGNHVTTMLAAATTDGAVDAIAVRSEHDGGPPPHRHSFGEWFLVLEGALELTGERDGAIVSLDVLHAGDSAWVPPGCWHGTINSSGSPARFVVIGHPGTMTRYFADAGVPVADDATPSAHEPPGPSELTELAVRHGIEFFRPSG